MEPCILAEDFFARGYSCSQSVMLAFAEQLGIDPAIAARLAAGFGGGIGRQGLTCGAVTGAVLALGMQYGSDDPEDKAAKENVYALVSRFSAKFAARNGSISCSGLLGCDISTSEGMAVAREHNMFKTRCPVYVGDAALILTEILNGE
jgi:C_GCAxxG_C_C family probable redox protein